MRGVIWIAIAMIAGATSSACTTRATTSMDDAASTPRDAATDDAASDAGSDASREMRDAAARDAGRDAATRDASPRADAAMQDAATPDAATPDAATVDAARPDAWRDDAGLCTGGPHIGLYAADDAPAHVTVRDFLVATGLLGAVSIGGPVVDDPGPPVVPARIPTLGELRAYDALFVWGSGSWDGDAMGDVLADYVDSGGGVVVGVFAQRAPASVGIAGRMAAGDYLPYVPGDYLFDAVTIGAVPMPSHPIMAGVASFGGTLVPVHDAPIAPGAALVASWSNGRPLIATLDAHAGRTVLLGAYPTRLWDTSTDGARLMANALRWAARCE